MKGHRRAASSSDPAVAAVQRARLDHHYPPASYLCQCGEAVSSAALAFAHAYEVHGWRRGGVL